MSVSKVGSLEQVTYSYATLHLLLRSANCAVQPKKTQHAWIWCFVETVEFVITGGTVVHPQYLTGAMLWSPVHPWWTNQQHKPAGQSLQHAIQSCLYFLQWEHVPCYDHRFQHYWTWILSYLARRWDTYTCWSLHFWHSGLSNISIWYTV